MERIKELESQLTAERQKIETLEIDSNKLFEAEETLVKARDENEILKIEIEELKKKEALEQLTADERIKSVEEDLKETRKLHDEARATIDTLSKKISESVAELETTKCELDNIRRQYDEHLVLCSSKDETIRNLQSELLSFKQTLAEKTAALEKIELESKEKEKQVEKEIERLKMDASSKTLDAEMARDELNNKVTEIEALNKQIGELKKDLELKSGDMERYQLNQSETIEILKKELEDARSSLKAKIDEMEELSMEKSREVSQKEMELSDARALINQNFAEIETLKANIENLKETEKTNQLETVDRFTHQIEDKEAVVLQLKNEINIKNGELEESNSTISKLQNIIDAKSKELEKLNTELETVKNQQQTEVNNVKKRNEEISELQLKCGDFERQLKIAEDRCGVLTEEKLSLERERDAFINSSGDIDAKLQQLSKELADKQNTLDQIRAQLSEKESAYLRLEQETKLRTDNLLNELEQQKQMYQQQLAAAEEAEKLQKTNFETLSVETNQLKEELTKSVKELKSELEEKELVLQKTLEEAAENDRQLKDELGRTTAELQRDVESYQNKLKVLSAEALEAKNLVAQRTEEAIEMDAKYKHLLAQSEQSDIVAKTEFEENLRKLQFELNEKQLQIQQLNSDISDLKQTNNQDIAHIHERDDRISKLTAELVANQELVKQLQADRDKLKSLNTEQEDKNAANREECNVLQTRIGELTEKARLADKYAQEQVKERDCFVDILNKLNITEKQKAALSQQLHSLSIVEKVQAIQFDDRDRKILELEKLVKDEKNNSVEKDKQLHSQKNEISRLQNELKEVSLRKSLLLFAENASCVCRRSRP